MILGRYPEGLYNFNSGFVRFFVRIYGWIYLQTDEWPPFGIADDPAYPIRVNIAPRAERQSRLKAFFRIILALPMLIVSYAVNYVHLWVAAIAWLTIVFRGYLPEGINNALTFCQQLLRPGLRLLRAVDRRLSADRDRDRQAAPAIGPPAPAPAAPPVRRPSR